MFGVWKRVKELEEIQDDMRTTIIAMMAHVEAVTLLGSEILDGLPRNQREDIVVRLKKFVADGVNHQSKQEWMTEEEQQQYSNDLSSMMQMYIESAEGRLKVGG